MAGDDGSPVPVGPPGCRSCGSRGAPPGVVDERPPGLQPAPVPGAAQGGVGRGDQRPAAQHLGGRPPVALPPRVQQPPVAVEVRPVDGPVPVHLAVVLVQASGARHVQVGPRDEAALAVAHHVLRLDRDPRRPVQHPHHRLPGRLAAWVQQRERPAQDGRSRPTGGAENGERPERAVAGPQRRVGQRDEVEHGEVPREGQQRLGRGRQPEAVDVLGRRRLPQPEEDEPAPLRVPLARADGGEHGPGDAGREPPAADGRRRQVGPDGRRREHELPRPQPVLRRARTVGVQAVRDPLPAPSPALAAHHLHHPVILAGSPGTGPGPRAICG